MIKNILTIWLIVMAIWVGAQNNPDSVMISHITAEVVVKADAAQEYDSHIERFKLLQERQFQSGDLGTWLDRRGIATVNTNGGPGAASSVRFHGLSSDHSVFCWNGIPLNSVSLGTCDVSLIPVFLFDEVSLSQQAHNTDFSASGLGVTMNLQNAFNSGEENHVALFASYNSLLNSFLGVEAEQKYSFQNKRKTVLNDSCNLTSMRNGKLSLRTKIFNQDIQNKFSYTDIYTADHPKVTQEHNNGTNKALLQDISFSWGKNVLEVHAWIQNKDMKLPSIMGSSAKGTSIQEDNLLRSMIQYKRMMNHASFELSSALLNESLLYRDHENADGKWQIDSRVRSSVFYNTAKSTLQVSKKFAVKLNGFYSMQDVKNTNYLSGSKMIHWFQLSTGMLYRQNRSVFEFDIRRDWREIKSRPSYCLSWQLPMEVLNCRIAPGAMISRKFRIPDMNELYWFPGGNPLLKPEVGLNYKTGIDLSYNSKKRLSFSLNPDIFYSKVTDWIQWIPVENGIWSPVNYKQVHSFGWQVPADVTWQTPKVVYQFDMRYVRTNTQWVNGAAWKEDIARTMIYTPRQVFSAEFKMVVQRFSVTVQNKYTSLRYTEEQNLSYRALKPYSIAGFRIGYNFENSRQHTILDFAVDNVFNVQYESVRSYAMPGRIFQLTLKSTLNYKNKQ